MIDLLSDSRVAVVWENSQYAGTSPYHPSDRFPEWAGEELGEQDNPAYRSVRRLFATLQLDPQNAGTVRWNPLGEIVKPGDVVVLKPNFVSHRNHGGPYEEIDIDCVITHGSVIRAVLDYVGKALNGDGKVIIGDCPIQATDWDSVIKHTGLREIQDYFKRGFPGVDLDIKDYRLGLARAWKGMVYERTIDQSNFDRYVELDLGKDSLLVPLMGNRFSFGVAQYPKHRMIKAHTSEVNRYLVPKDLIAADVLINLPKVKTHEKAGVTVALKNLVGINGHKDYLPHFRFGSPHQGGDEYPEGNWFWDLMWFCNHADWERDNGALKIFASIAGRLCAFGLPVLGHRSFLDRFLGAGAWYGNDTLWRTILDINRAFLYSDRGTWKVEKEISRNRQYFAIADGLVAGDKEGPLCPSPRKWGGMLASFNPLALDSVATALMGLEVRKLPQVWEGFRLSCLPLARFGLDEISILGMDPVRTIADIYNQKAFVPCTPSRGMVGHLEYADPEGGTQSPDFRAR